MPTIPFLLQVAQTAQHVAVPTALASAENRFAEWFVRLVPIAISLYVLFSGRSREDRKAMDKRIDELLLFKETQQERATGLQLQHERAMESVMERLKEHEGKLGDVSRIREEMAGMRAELKYVVEGYKEISHKLDRLLERQSK